MVIGGQALAPVVLRPPFLQFRQQRLERRIDMARHLLFRHHLVRLPDSLLQQTSQCLAPHAIRDAAFLGIGMAPGNHPAIAQGKTRRFFGQACLANARFSHQHNTLRGGPLKRDGGACHTLFLSSEAISAMFQRRLSHTQQLPQRLSFPVAAHQRTLVAAPKMRLLRIGRQGRGAFFVIIPTHKLREIAPMLYSLVQQLCFFRGKKSHTPQGIEETLAGAQSLAAPFRQRQRQYQPPQHILIARISRQQPIQRINLRVLLYSPGIFVLWAFYFHHARGEILSNIYTLFPSISSHMKSIPVGTMTDTIATLATARLSAKIHLLAVGDEIVHLLTVSPMYVSPKTPYGSSPLDRTIGGIS